VDGCRVVEAFDEIHKSFSEMNPSGRFARSFSWGGDRAECRELAFVLSLDNCMDDEQAAAACEQVLADIVSTWPALREWYVTREALTASIRRAFCGVGANAKEERD
jgi:hypothetical protein